WQRRLGAKTLGPEPRGVRIQRKGPLERFPLLPEADPHLGGTKPGHPGIHPPGGKPEQPRPRPGTTGQPSALPPPRSRSPRRASARAVRRSPSPASPGGSLRRHSSLSPPLSPAPLLDSRADPFGRRAASPARPRLAPLSPEPREYSQPPELQPQLPDLTSSFQDMFARALAQVMASSLTQQPQAPRSRAPQDPPRGLSDRPSTLAAREARSPSPSTASEASDLEEGELKDVGFSEDEVPQGEEDSTVAGLFPPSLFSSLLRKAVATADLDPPSDPQPAAESSGKGKSKKKKGPFHRPPVAKEEIPTPDMFMEVLKSQWVKPGSFPT
ncbi:basic salivary proline-rich protein 1-like, partial [Thamnophis elegans]|uniref:basic salivary proline-rich protein 1-like n=1 Tax=Thamnophis elegans TaxID=35005 RepID=UPI0013789882